jgi:integrase/recombinase XerD
MDGEMARQAEEYLALRRRLGCELKRPGRLVRQFAWWCGQQHVTAVTADLVATWATLPGDVSPWYQWLRFSAARGFTIWLHAHDPAHQVPPADMLPCRQRRPDPRLLEPGEIAALIAAAGTRRPSSHAATYQTLISLMAITGMRLCEAVRMDDTDLDGEGLVLTLHGKNHKDRQIPLDASAVEALRAYARVRDAAHPARTSTAFFASTRGKRMAADQTRAMFARLVTKAGLAAGPSGRRPTLVSLRHTFAVTTMAAMLDGGASPDASFPALSMWMGHKKPMSATRTAAPVERPEPASTPDHGPDRPPARPRTSTASSTPGTTLAPGPALPCPPPGRHRPAQAVPPTRTGPSAARAPQRQPAPKSPGL